MSYLSGRHAEVVDTTDICHRSSMHFGQSCLERHASERLASIFQRVWHLGQLSVPATYLCGFDVLHRMNPDRTTNAGATDTAITTGILGQVLLVIVLGVIKLV